MNIDFSPEDEQFRLEARAWLDQNLPEEARQRGSLRTHVSKEHRLPFYRKLSERGWLAPGWPKEVGGAGFSMARRFILSEEMQRIGAPTLDSGVTMVGPLLIEHGTAEQKKRFLPKILKVEELWCQGYSEPGAGSDLAALATRAEIDGDDFILNGQKVWTSVAYESDWMFILARTDAHAAKKQTGISFLLMDMRSPGIRIEPIQQISGQDDFCEVFLSDVRVPQSNLVGNLNEGWGYAKRLLEVERRGSATNYPMHRTIEKLIEYSRASNGGANGRPLDADLRRRLAQASMEADATVYLGYRSLSRILAGLPPGQEASAIKVFASESLQRLAQIGMDFMGPKGQIWREENFSPEDNAWPMVEITSRSLTIARGTSEVQRNIIAERVLGMPR